MKRPYIPIITIIIALIWLLSATSLIITLQDGSTDSLNTDDITKFYIADSSVGAIVRLSEPFNGAVNVSLFPELRWRIIPGQQYELMVVDNPEFAAPIVHVYGLYENIYQLIDSLESQTLYYWRVRSSNTTEWSAVWQFTTYTPVAPGQIRSFAIINDETPNSLKLLFSSNDEICEIIAFLSPDGLSFTDTIRLDATSPVLTGLEANQICYIRLKGSNSAGAGPVSEVLAGIPTNEDPGLLIVNGFDRSSTGNTYNFIRQHAAALNFFKYVFESATNDAITDGLVLLNHYGIVDYILGEESTVDETFSNAEQDSIELFLREGGKLFVSGSEIAWDLDYKGSDADKAFCHNYLKIGYAADAPNNQSNTWYSVEPLTGTLFSDMPGFSFDNGSHGTYNVDWPDVFTATNGGQGFLKFSNYSASNSYAGVLYDGLFPNGTVPGKLVITGFPFETIYLEANRNTFMSEVMRFFEYVSDIKSESKPAVPGQFALFQNYPNPFNSSTIIPFQLPRECDVRITVYDLLGREVLRIADRRFPAGFYRLSLATESLSSGEYLYIMETSEFRDSKKLGIIK
jgi:hypothetical protein